MATAPTASKKKGVARQVKDIKGIVLFKGTIEGDIKVVFDPWEAMEAKDADNTLQSKSFTVPRKRRPAPNQGGDGGPTA